MNKSLFAISALSCAIAPGLAHGQDDGPDSQSSSRALEEIVVTGYSTTEERKLLGAVDSVDIDDVEDMPSGNIMQNLQGRLPGVQITTSGNPNPASTVRIRGQGIGGLGFNEPLYVIDGVPTTKGMHELNPNDIKSIQVLRDAATGSVYGARAANGVIVITTKKGSDAEGVNIRYNQSFQDYSYDLNPLNTQQRARAVFQAAVNDGTDPNNASPLYTYDWNGDYDSPALNEIRLPEYLDSAQTMRPASTNWFDQVTRTAKVSDLHISAGKSSDDSNLYASFGYYNAEGVVDESQFERMAFRVNSSFDFMDGDLTIGENFTFTNQVSNKVNDLAEGILNLSIEQQSIVPVHTVDGEGWGGPAPGITDRDNPVRLIEMNKDNENTYNRVVGNAYIDYRPMDDLLLRSNVGLDYGQFYYRDYTRAFQAGNLNFDDELVTTHNWNQTLVWTNTAEYSWDFANGHFLKVLGGVETVDFETEGFNGANQGYASDSRDYAFLSQGTEGTEVSGSGDAWTMLSYFTQVDYDYQGRYLASVTVRRDGSSRFGENHRYGTFPAVSAGWFISDEAFFDVDFIDELKLRASWGENGNQEIDTRATSTIYESRYATTTLFTTQQDEGTAYDLAGADTGNLPSGFARVQIGNDDLKWETSVQTNVGLDFEMFDGTLSGSLDWFEKTTEDILTRTQPLATQGEGASKIVNGGTIENSGVELSLTYANDFEIQSLGVFDYEISGNISSAENTVIDLPDDVVNSFPGNGRDKTILGESINAVFGYVADGLFQNQEEVEAHADQAGAAPGRIRYRDLDGNGEINEADQKYFTTTDPDFTYGVNFRLGYENWDFNMFWQGVHGGQIRNHWRFFTDFTSLNAGSNYGDRVLGAWSPENTDSNVPALTLVDNNNEARSSTFFWEDASYLKLRDLSVGYTPSDSFWGAIGASTGRFYIQGQNLLTITPDGTLAQDPETPGATFPIPRSINLGVNLTF
ncbi:SusC/RagA family TonB-linked outer membrane protein [Marinimicrobium agarilyticum]|uniref:SusC/RagA family TonB-linked outer membrane protein n=1 Tax=Marinimicrobium agarilyticum TaxID=306546 RepID=UPI00040A4928|nr:SusC/RagA family TonB-linked outer membrane protein [Marinimicrobium agarilyticum]